MGIIKGFYRRIALLRLLNHPFCSFLKWNFLFVMLVIIRFRGIMDKYIN